LDNFTLYDYLFEFLEESDWEDENIPEQIRAIFTTICLVERIDADTMYCDNLILRIFQKLDEKGESLNYDDFENFMLQYIV